MSRKLSRSAIAKKAWKTRRMNEAMDKAPQPKLTGIMFKGVPFIKNNKSMTLEEYGEKLMNDASTPTTLSICNDIDNTLTTLEARLSAINARINAIL